MYLLGVMLVGLRVGLVLLVLLLVGMLTRRVGLSVMR